MSEDAYLSISPGATLDYVFDWATSLGGDTIASTTIEIAPTHGDSPLTPSAGTPAKGSPATDVTVFLSGFQRGKVYRITNEIVTAGGRTDRRTLVLRCGERS